MSSARSDSGEAAVRWLLDHERAVLVAFALALLLAAAGALSAVVRFGGVPKDNSLRIWFLEDDPALVRYDEFQAEWGNDEAVVIALFDPEGVLRRETLELVAQLSTRLQGLERVVRVTSLATVHSVFEDAAGEVEVARYFQPPLDEAGAAAARARVLSDPIYQRHLLAPDGKSTVLSVQLETSRDFDRRRKAILGEIRTAVSETLRAAGRPFGGGPGGGWAWGGIGVIHVAINAMIMQDTARFLVLTSALLLFGLSLAFRRALAVAACLLSVGAATALLVGAYFGAGYSLNLVTMVLPPLVMVVGLTDSVYFLLTFQLVRARTPELPIRESVVRALGACFWPGLFNSVTTSIGFLAFLAAPMQVVRHLGAFAGLGVACAFLSSLVVCALLLERFPERIARPQTASEGPRDDLVARLLLAASLAVAVLAGVGISRLKIDSWSLGYFPPSHEIRQHDQALLDSIGPYLPLELVLKAPGEAGVRRPDVLAGVASLCSVVVAEEPSVSRVTSLPTVVQRLTQVLSGDEQAALPADPQAIDQVLTFYDPRAREDPVWLADAHWSTTRFQFAIKNEGAMAGRALLERIHARAPAHLPPDVELISGGYMPLYAKLVEHLVVSQVRSIAITVVVVFFLIALLFRSLRYALLSFLPNVLPVALTLALMGFLGINLDMATVMVAAISLGVAVDDTIHFLYAFRAAHALSGDAEQAVRDTITTTGRAILSTSLVVVLGFLVLGFATIKTISLFGLLLCVTMLAALVAEFLVTPALLLSFPPSVLPQRAAVGQEQEQQPGSAEQR